MTRFSAHTLAVALTSLLACAGSLPTASQRDALLAGVPLADLHDGRDRYVAKCSGCHKLYTPAEYDDEAWAAHVPAMREKAKLSDEDIVAIVGYVTAMNEPSALPLADARPR